MDTAACSARRFLKEVKLLVPNSQRMNRGGHTVNEIVDMCRGEGYSDLVLVQEHRGVRLVSIATVSIAMVSGAMVSIAMVSVAIVSITVVSTAIVSRAIASVAIVSVAIVSVAIVNCKQ